MSLSMQTEPMLKDVSDTPCTSRKCVRMANPVEVDIIPVETNGNKKRDIETESQTVWNFPSSPHVSNFDRKGWEAIYATREPWRNAKTTFREKLYNFLDRPKGWKPLIYHVSVFLLVVASYIFGVFSTVPEYNDMAEVVLHYMERILIVIFAAEYLLRFWSAGCRGKFRGFKGRLRYFFQPLLLVDLLIVITSAVFFTVEFNGQIVATYAVRGFRFLQIARMLHIDRQGGTWQLLKSVVISHKQELLTTVYVGMLGLILSSYFLYLVEKEDPKQTFVTYADALWWGLITMTTIGYGDKVPSTATGKLLAAVCALFTVSFFALPAGILGSGFALKVQQQQKRKKFSRQVPAAAILIQSAWRYYASGKHFSSVAAWKIPLAPTNSHIPVQKKKPSSDLFKRLKSRQSTLPNVPYGVTFPAINMNDSLEKTKYVSLEGNAFFPWQEQRPLTQNRIPYIYSAPDLRGDNMHGSAGLPDLNDSQTFTPDYDLSITSTHTYKSETGYDVFKDWIMTQKLLTEAHKNAIRAIRKMKYFVALRKFQEARRPFEVSDVIEQYTHGQINMMTRIKELQRRLDNTLGKPGSHFSGHRRKSLTIGMQLQELDEQVVDIQRKMNCMDKKLDQISHLINERMDMISSILPKLQSPQMLKVINDYNIQNQT